VELGIDTTPVIDLARSRIIVSYRTGPNGLPSTGTQRLVALDLGSGDVVKVDGLPLDRRISDDSQWNELHRSRASLLLDNDKVYVAFAGRCEGIVNDFKDP